MVEDTTTVTLDGTDYDIKPANKDDFVNLVLGMDDVLPLARGDSETFETVGGTTVSIDTTIDPDDDRLEEELDEARAEGFGAGVFFAASMMMEGVGFGADSQVAPSGGDEEMMGLNALYPEVTAMEEELESLEGEGIEATMFEPMDGYEDGDVPRGE